MSDRKFEKPLDPDFVLNAYCSGFFPMAESRDGPVSWYSPDPRAVIPLDAFRVSRSLRQVIKKKIYSIRINSAFASVIGACAYREETWISGEIIRVYTALHERGFAHSVESWHGDKLAGGLYGVAIAGAFFGESMFTNEKDASKVALAYLVDLLRQKHFLLLDTQIINEHVRQFGAREISRQYYLKLLAKALSARTQFTL